MFKVGILGAAGYSGIELLKILKRHSNVEVVVITSDANKGKKLHEVFPEFRGQYDLMFEEFNIDAIINRVEVVFFALPAKASMEIAERFLEQHKLVVDLSGGFRLKDKEDYKTWYHFEHKFPALLKQAVYGLSELFRDQIVQSRFISNPGCYPTGISLGLAPALEKGIVDPSKITIDAKSGISGKGRSADISSLYYELNENMYAYKIGKHQHQPEIQQTVARLSGKKDPEVLFVPQVVPMDRGILANTYCTLNKSMTVEEIHSLYKDFYKNEHFVRVTDIGESPKTKAVSGTNYCDIGVSVFKKTLVITSAIDNLVKGAAGQAVQNFNIMTGQEETEGLIS